MKSLVNWVRELVASFFGYFRDPIRDGRYAIKDREKRITMFTTKIANAKATLKTLESDRDKARHDSDKYMEAARAAGVRGDEKGVRRNVIAKNQAAERLVKLDRQIASNTEQLEKFQGQLREAREQIENAKSNISQLEVRQESAQMRKELAEAAANLGGDDLGHLDTLEKEVQRTEFQADALEELNVTEDAEAERAYQNSKVDSEVEALLGKSKSVNLDEIITPKEFVIVQNRSEAHATI